MKEYIKYFLKLWLLYLTVANMYSLPVESRVEVFVNQWTLILFIAGYIAWKWHFRPIKAEILKEGEVNGKEEVEEARPKGKQGS